MATLTRNQIAFEELGLGAILKRYVLRVPPHQREYAWRADTHVTQLLQDFARAVNEGGPYFLGTIVTIPRADGQLDVVDGQQRLATTAILLAAMRDYLQEVHETVIIESINNDFLYAINRERREKVPRLTLNVDDNALFECIVTGPCTKQPTRASHERLLAARRESEKHVRRVVAPHNQRQHGDLLNRWLRFIEHDALVVLLRVPREHDAYKMFETLNDRGLRTSQADLVKSFLIGVAGGRVNEVQSRWSYMRGALESIFDEEDITITFLRHSLIVQSGHLREAQVFDKVQNIVKSEQTAVRFAETLETLANVYVATFNPENERWNSYPEKVRRAIQVFNLFDIKPMRPLILAVAAKFDQNETAKTFDFLIALGVRLIIASSTRSGSVEEPMAEAAKGVFDDTIKKASGVRRALTSVMPVDAVFQEAFETARVSNARFARYYLRSLEMAAKNEPEPWFVPQEDKAIINLEHVLPRRPEQNWPTFKEDEVDRFSARLGNLALLNTSGNSDLKSKPFSEKKPHYAASPYLLTSQVADEDEWTPDAIHERQKRLAEIAVRAWPAKV
jgi:Protein of unknown function DUF262/Protein of unknown function (DUF1524)